MMLGRAGVIGLYSRKRLQQQKGNENKRGNYLAEHQKEFKEKHTDKERLVFKDYPIAAWSLGVIMMIAGGYLIILISLGRTGHFLSEFYEGFWWQYVLSMFIFLLGFSFLLAMEYERVELNKKLPKFIPGKYQILVVTRTNILWKKRFQARDLSKLKDIQIVKKGHDSMANSTIHYILEFTFDEEKKIQIIEAGSRVTIKKKLVEIKTFLEKQIDFENIPIINKSTSNKASKNKKSTKTNPGTLIEPYFKDEETKKLKV